MLSFRGALCPLSVSYLTFQNGSPFHRAPEVSSGESGLAFQGPGLRPPSLWSLAAGVRRLREGAFLGSSEPWLCSSRERPRNTHRGSGHRARACLCQRLNGNLSAGSSSESQAPAAGGPGMQSGSH